MSSFIRSIHRSSAALAVLVCACGPRVAPAGPGAEPELEQPVAEMPARQRTPATRQVVVGEMCPDVAAGRPAVMPLIVRKVGWTSEPDAVTAPVERAEARQFSVLGWDGRRAGVFTVVGLSTLGPDQQAAVGGYAGASPCSGPPGADGQREVYEVCVAAQQHCGLAVAEIEPEARTLGEAADPLELAAAGACVSEDKLLFDVDGDGRPEAYDLASFVDQVRAPTSEVTEVARGEASCQPRFAISQALPPADPRHFRGMDVVGVLDLDADGRSELVLSYQYSDRRTWAVYSALDTPARLELVGEAMTWPR